MHSLGQQTSGEPQLASPQAVEDSALVAAVLRKDRKATAEFVARGRREVCDRRCCFNCAVDSDCAYPDEANWVGGSARPVCVDCRSYRTVVGFERPSLRVNASVVFVFFLFELIGRVLLGHEAAPKNVVVALALDLAGAYFF